MASPFPTFASCNKSFSTNYYLPLFITKHGANRISHVCSKNLRVRMATTPPPPCDKSFSTNYLLLKPEKASLVDIFGVLFSRDVGKHKFIEVPDGTEEPWERRWLIFLAGVVMILLQANAKPLADLGDGIENWLNLLSENGGFLNLIIHYLQGCSGKVVHPVKGSAEYVSVVGYLDKRVDLDSRVMKHIGDKGYYEGLCMMASKSAYENHNFVQAAVTLHWKMDFIGFYDFWNDYQQKHTTHAFLMDDTHDNIIVTFRGTEPFEADPWCTDFDISWYEIPGLGRIHAGFMKALGLQKSQGWPLHQDPGKPVTAYYAIRDLLKEHLQKNEGARFLVTGHSLGGALAAIFPAILMLHKEEWLLQRLAGVYTYGQPRVGDKAFADFMTAASKKYGYDDYRFVYSFDLVPRVPADDAGLMFQHFGTCVYYDSLYQGRILEEQPNMNYFNIIWLVPKFLNAWWELIRSFIIPFTHGPEYTETSVMRIIRVVGLLIPGVPPHCPPDYVNSTRLGSSKILTSAESKSHNRNDE